MTAIEIAYKIDAGEESLSQAEYLTLALDYIRIFDLLHVREADVAYYREALKRFHAGRNDG